MQIQLEKDYLKSLLSCRNKYKMIMIFQNKKDQMTLKDHYVGSRDNAITFKSIIAGENGIATFEPFITSYSDNWSSDWNAEHVFGRSDPIYTWKSTGRSISLGFKAVAASYKEAYANMCNIQKLQKMLYPYYYTDGINLATTVAKAPLVRIRFANLIMNTQKALVYGDAPNGNRDYNDQNGLLGVIKTLSCTPDLEEGMIEGPGAGLLFPKVWNVTVDFGVLHENILGWSKENRDRLQTQVEAGFHRPVTITESHLSWIGDLTGDETGYSYGINSDGCIDGHAAFEGRDGFGAYGDAINTGVETEGAVDVAVSTQGTPNKDALIEEAEIVQEQLTRFGSFSRLTPKESQTNSFSPSTRGRGEY